MEDIHPIVSLLSVKIKIQKRILTIISLQKITKIKSTVIHSTSSILNAMKARKENTEVTHSQHINKSKG